MENIKRRDLEMPYISDASVMEEQKACRRILQELNFADRSDFEKVSRIVKELLGKSENAFINPPFYSITAPTSKWERTSSPTITVPSSMWRK